MPEEDLTESAETALEAVLDRASEDDDPARDWKDWASISTMVMALLSAVGGMMAGHSGNEAMIGKQELITDRIDRNQAQLRLEILQTRMLLMQSSGQPLDEQIKQTAETLEQQLESVYEEVYEEERETTISLQAHELFSLGTTLLSAAITITGMSIVIRRQALWLLGGIVSCFGAAAIVFGFVAM